MTESIISAARKTVARWKDAFNPKHKNMCDELIYQHFCDQGGMCDLENAIEAFDESPQPAWILDAAKEIAASRKYCAHCGSKDVRPSGLVDDNIRCGECGRLSLCPHLHDANEQIASIIAKHAGGK